MTFGPLSLFVVSRSNSPPGPGASGVEKVEESNCLVAQLIVKKMNLASGNRHLCADVGELSLVASLHFVFEFTDVGRLEWRLSALIDALQNHPKCVARELPRAR